jgi:5'-nucleotidase
MIRSPRDRISGIRRARLAAAGAVELSIVEATAGYLHVTMAETGNQPDPGTDSALLADGYAAVTALRPVCEATPADLPWPAG